MKKTIGSIVKPVSSLAVLFNAFMKKIEERTSPPDISPEGINFVNLLLDEMKDAEQGIFAFFTEFLLMQHYADKMVEIENEVALAGVLNERIKSLLKPDFIEIYFEESKGGAFRLVSSYPAGRKEGRSGFHSVARECFESGESRLHGDKSREGRKISLLAVPLRTTREKYGAILAGKKGSRSFSPEDSALVVAAAAVVSFAISNVKLMHGMIRNERLVTMGEPLGGLSHDIRNRLNGIGLGISLIEEAERSGDSRMAAHGRDTVKKGYEMMKDLVLSMVDYSRARETTLVKTDLNSLLNKALDDNRDIFGREGIKVYARYGENLPGVDLDPERMGRVFSNLFQNAADAVRGRKGIIRAGTRFLPGEGVVEFWISDNGTGIPEGNLDKIFDIFYSTKGSRGTGFGLAIVQKIIFEHKGSIRVDSTPGRGASFHIRIPVET